MPFYALPYIKKPLDHPAIKFVFEESWGTGIR